jgi:hypothetical protein
MGVRTRSIVDIRIVGLDCRSLEYFAIALSWDPQLDKVSAAALLRFNSLQDEKTSCTFAHLRLITARSASFFALSGNRLYLLFQLQCQWVGGDRVPEDLAIPSLHSQNETGIRSFVFSLLLPIIFALAALTSFLLVFAPSPSSSYWVSTWVARKGVTAQELLAQAIPKGLRKGEHRGIECMKKPRRMNVQRWIAMSC